MGSSTQIMTLTSTYDHRVIQGAQSGEYLARLHALLLGEDGFYDDIFGALRVPYEPIRWAQDISTDHEDQIPKQARIMTGGGFGGCVIALVEAGNSDRDRKSVV